MRPCSERFRSRARWLLASGCVALLAGCIAAVEPAPGEEDEVAAAEQALIFGSDNRQEYGQASAQHQFWSRSVAVVMKKTELSCSGSNCALEPNPWTTELSNGQRLCSDVRYRGQSTLAQQAPNFGGICTGFLVAPDLIVSAAHCMYLTGVGCSDTRFVFGYQADASGGSIPTSVPQQDVYSCTQVTEVYFPNYEEDWALYKLDRPVPNRVPLPVRYTAQPALDTPLVIIGHPNLLPMKISPSGTVKGLSETLEFQHNVDSFGGNSGSPVFDRDTGVVQGIHVAPPDGFSHFYASSDASGPCRAEETCPSTGCVPEDPPFTPLFSNATRITRLGHLIPLVPALTMVATAATHWP